MKWLVGIALVMLAVHLWWRRGERRLRKQKRIEEE